jgi:hypothetical protein
MSKALEELNIIATDYNIDTSRSWPRAANSLSRRLKPLLSNLREGYGINITITRYTSGDRKTRGTHILRVSQIPSLPSLSSPDQNYTRIEGQKGDDITGSDDIYRHQDSISSPNYTQNHVQNSKGDDSEDGDDIFGTEGVGDKT